MVARDPADTPTEQFVPEFDDDVSDDEPDSLRKPATTAGDAESRDDPADDAPTVSTEPCPEQSEHGISGIQAPPDPDRSGQPPDLPLATSDVSGQGDALDQSVGDSEVPNLPRENLPEPSPSRTALTVRLAKSGSIRPAGPGRNGAGGGTATTAPGSVRIPGTLGRSTSSAGGTGLTGGTASARGGGVGGAVRTVGASTGLARAYRLIGWERTAVVGVLVLCTAVAGVLTGLAVVRASSGWTVTWGGTEQVDGRRPAPEGSRSPSPPQFDRPQYPSHTNSVSPTPSASASAPRPTGSVRPSRSPKPPTTPTPGVSPSGSPTATEPSPSRTGDPGNEG